MLHQELGDVPQRLVAGPMPKPVVDLLEVVEVHEGERERLTETAVTLELFFHADREVPAVVDIRQRVLEGEIFQPRVAERDGGLRRQRAHQALVLGVEGHDASPLERVDELQHAEDVVRRILERHHQDRLGAVVQARVDARVERIGAIGWNRVRIVQVEDVAGERDVTGEAQLAEAQWIGLEPAPHLFLA